MEISYAGDEANVAISLISMDGRSVFDWKKIFEGATWYHFAGITPALSDSRVLMATSMRQALMRLKSL